MALAVSNILPSAQQALNKITNPSPFASSMSGSTTPVVNSPIMPSFTGGASGSYAPTQTASKSAVTSSAPNYSANQTVAAGANTPGYTYVDGKLASVGGVSTGLVSNTSAPVNTQQSAPLYTPPQTPTQTPQPQPTYQAPQNSGLYGQLTTGLANTQQSPVGQAAAQGLLNSAQSNPLESGKAYDVYNQAVQRLADLKQKKAQLEGNIETAGTDLNLQTGQEGVLNRVAASEIDAAQQAVNQAQQALGYGIQEQGQQQSGYNSALTGTNNQQQLQQNALGTAAGLAAPIISSYGQANYNPTSSNSSSGGAVSPSDPFYQTLQSYAQQAASGQYSAIPSSITSNAVLNAQLNQMAKSINPSYNPVTSSAQSGITTQQEQQKQGYQSALQQGQNLAAQATDLIKTFNLNPAELNKANGVIQTIASNVSNPNYKTLNNYLADISARYSQILTPPGGTATDTTRSVAAGMLDHLASGTSLQQVLSSLDQQAQAVIAGVNTTGSYGSAGTVPNPWK